MTFSSALKKQLLILIVLGCTAFNFFHNWQKMGHEASMYWSYHKYITPGWWTVPLKPYLAKVQVAGYYNDRYDPELPLPQPALSLGWQLSQYSLSPTLLDWDHCFDRDYVLFDCSHPGCELALAKKHGLSLVASLGARLVLMKRGK
jgi:hypothetical protein